MRRLVVLALVALLAAPLVAPRAHAQPDFRAVDALMRDSLARIGGGAVVRVVRADTVVFERAYGTFALGEAVEIASASKWLSGSVILSLVDSGHLSLDSPLSQFFPDLPAPKRAITIRQLFALTSGITGDARTTCINETATTLAACTDELLARPLTFAPGAGFFYGGASMQVAARAAEIAAGRPWATLFAERIAIPLGMTQTRYLSQTNPWVAGGLVSSAADYTAFLQMVLNGGVAGGRRVLSPAAVAAMLADQSGVESGATPVLFSPFSRYAGSDPDLPTDALGYGVGVWREQLTEAGALRHASSLGAYGFSPWADVERRLGGALVVLDDGPDVVPTYLELKRRIAAALGETSTAGDGPVGDAPTARPRLDAPRPNPASGPTRLRFTLPAAGRVRLDVFDARGRPVARLVQERLGAGEHETTLDAAGLARGLYVAVLRVEGAVADRRRIVVR